MNHKGTQVMETARTILRPFRLDDTQAMFDNWATDEEVTRYLTWRPHANLKVTQDLMETWCAHYTEKAYHWALVLKETNQPIGSIGIVRLDEAQGYGEIGYAISRAHWNRGIVTEAMGCLFRYFFNELGMERIDGLHVVENPASGKVMQKLGMSFLERIDGEMKDNNGNPVDVFRYTLDKADFHALHIRKAYAGEVEEIGELYDSLTDHLALHTNYCGWKRGLYPTMSVAAEAFSEDCLYVAVMSGKVVGTCALNSLQAPLYEKINWRVKTERPLVVHTLAVHPDFCGQGVAQALLMFANTLARQEGIPSIRLDTAEMNLPAIRLYEKCGYLHVGSGDLGIERSGIKLWYLFEKLV